MTKQCISNRCLLEGDRNYMFRPLLAIVGFLIRRKMCDGGALPTPEPNTNSPVIQLLASLVCRVSNSIRKASWLIAQYCGN